jgi:hypothetical protein
MKKIINLVTLRAGIATLCLSFVSYPTVRLSFAVGATGLVTSDLKSESQFRSEAARYDAAIRAISGITTMKLETGDDLKKALAILDRERPNLKLHFSKFVVLGLSDSTFSGAVKKRVSDQQAAEAFAKELEANHKAILMLDGAEALRARIRRSAESDAAVLRRAGERLKEVAAKLKKAAQQGAAPGLGVTDEFRVIRTGFGGATEPVDAHHTLSTTPQRRGINPVIRVLLIILRTDLGQRILDVLRPFENEDVDEVAACQEEADARYLTCVAAANDLPSGFPFFQREVEQGACYGDWLFTQAACLTLYV